MDAAIKKAHTISVSWYKLTLRGKSGEFIIYFVGEKIKQNESVNSFDKTLKILLILMKNIKKYYILRVLMS